MKRQIIKIDENLCNGCGQCAAGCAEGAIQMVDGKARLVSEVFCDGLGACIGECPVNAITVEHREAEPYDERKTIEKLVLQGEKVVTLHLEHLKSHGQKKYYEEGIETLKELGFATFGEKKMASEQKPCGCPHATQEALTQTVAAKTADKTPISGDQMMTNWPIQLHLINPDSTVFDDADLVIAADCTAFSLPDFYKRFTKNKVLIVFCPKLDHATDIYIEKLAAIFSTHHVRTVTLLRMLVPCCGGTSMIVNEALKQAGQEIDVAEYIVNFDGTTS